jgi:hypothetical protein
MMRGRKSMMNLSLSENILLFLAQYNEDRDSVDLHRDTQEFLQL